MDEVFQLIETDLGPPKKKSGRWWFWECPFHPDKHPSLGVSMAEGNWHCFQCGAGGDARAWMLKYRHLRVAHYESKSFQNQTKQVEKAVNPPGDIWQARAQALIREFSANLWWTQGKNARWYLYGRGLNGKILEKAQVGYNPIHRFEPLEKWGLSPASPEEKAVFIPAGICIP